uniref:RasGEF domain family member 1B n=1 Tax=Neolamprologus brichardi TaxID=32507 RepID=A0A3Q4HMZ9_NEOBR
MPQTPPFTGQLNTGSYNKNLYQTKEEGYPGLYYNDNNLVSGSLEALIHHLVPTVDYYPDRTYIFTFLLSSRLFIHPYELMSKVCHLCTEQQRLGDPQADKVFRKIAPKILQLLTEWTETFPYDFRDERMMRSLKELTHRLASGDEVSPFCLSSFPLTTTRLVQLAESYFCRIVTWHHARVCSLKQSGPVHLLLCSLVLVE